MHTLELCHGYNHSDTNCAGWWQALSNAEQPPTASSATSNSEAVPSYLRDAPLAPDLRGNEGNNSSPQGAALLARKIERQQQQLDGQLPRFGRAMGFGSDEPQRPPARSVAKPT